MILKHRVNFADDTACPLCGYPFFGFDGDFPVEASFLGDFLGKLVSFEVSDQPVMIFNRSSRELGHVCPLKLDVRRDRLLESIVGL